MNVRLLTILLLLISVSLPVAAESTDGNIYIYRNDGKFNAFFSAEVDSICYSNTGSDGSLHQHPVIQEIHTQDSIYRIPLAVIDSISVQKPETIFASGVKQLYPEYAPYILGASDSSIRLANTLPYNMNLRKGDILFYDRCDAMFESGFAGRVVSISNDGNLNIECEPVELTDIYQQFFGFGETVLENPVSSQALGKRDGAERSAGIDIGVSVISTIRPLIRIQDGKTYIEVSIGLRYQYNAGIHVSGKTSRRVSLGEGQIPFGQPIPGVIFKVGFENYAEAELSGGIDFGFTGGGSFSRTIIYDNGTLNISQPSVSHDPDTFNGSISGSGSIAVGTGLKVGVEFVGKIFNLELIPSVGTCLDISVSKDFSDFDKHKFYELAKESTITSSIFGQIEIKGQLGFGKAAKPFGVPLTGKIKFNPETKYLLPDFADLDISVDQESITVSSTALRPLLIPCKVGLAVLDEYGTEIDSYFENESVFMNEVNLKKTFNKGLSGGVKYTVRPIVRLLNFDMYATPEEVRYLDAELTTGPAFATTYSVRTSGSIGTKLSDDIEVGFVYSPSNSSPTVENATKVVGELVDEQIIQGGFSGLSAGTTYYYCAYVHFNDRYYYGNAQCVTTKRNCDRSDAENIGGDYVKGTQPLASIGSAFDIEEESAKIELDFLYIHPSASCRYHLEGDDPKGNRIASDCVDLGTVTGRNTIELHNLVPGTSYRFWCDIKGTHGNSVSPLGTFQTTPSPEPRGVVTEIADIQMESAKVTCKYDNIKEGFECGIIVSAEKWDYRHTMRPDNDGFATLDLTGLLAETNYSITPYVITTYDPEPIEGKSPVEFSTEGPDITGMWVLTTEIYVAPGPFDVNFLPSGKTNYFWGLNYLEWSRDGKNLFLSTPRQSTQVGVSDPTTAWEFYGRFNDDFTICSGYTVLMDIRHDEVLRNERRPFTLTRKAQ